MRAAIVVLSLSAALLFCGPAAAQRCSELPARSLEQAVCKANATRAMADRGGPTAPALYAAYARAVVDIWNEWGHEACDSHDASCTAHAQRLLEAARAFGMAHMVGRLISLARAVANPETGVDDGNVVLDAARIAADAYRTLGWVDKAIEIMASAADRHPKTPRAIEMLLDAHRLAHALGDRKGASALEEKFVQHYGTNEPEHRRELDVVAAKASAADGDFGAVITRLEKILPKKQSAPTLWHLEAETLLARAYQRQGDDKKARAFDANVAQRWQKMQTTKERASWAHVDAIAETLLRRADRAADRAEAVRPDAAAIERWLTRHQDREMRAALAAYDAVEALEPVARARWRVAAALGKARVRRALNERIRRAAPTATAQLAVTSDAASAAYAACLALSTKLYHYDESTLACEDGLAVFAPEQTFEGLWLVVGAPVRGWPEPPVVDDKVEAHQKRRWRARREEAP